MLTVTGLILVMLFGIGVLMAVLRRPTALDAASIADCQQAVERMPCHFGAWAGLGHGHAHLGQTCDAIRCYRRALQINPHLECIAEAVKELQRQH
jgi:cytochrome c-type biogenesis protein CcmH/NrfG